MGTQKKQLQLLLILIICMVLYSAWYNYDSSDKAQDNMSGVIRFHVIANSDSSDDQDLKLKVRDGVLQTINDDLAQETMMRHNPADVQDQDIQGENTDTIAMEIDDTRTYINENMDNIIAVAEEIIDNAGYDYTVTAELGICWIPEKKYGDVTFPAGNYEALNITIGEGKGQNWWCVLFPPLCIIDPEGQTLSGMDVVTSGSATKAPRLKLKFKSKEVVDDIFNL